MTLLVPALTNCKPWEFSHVSCSVVEPENAPALPGALFTRALLVADLEPQESIDLQSLGLGPHRMLGCGLFVGHKNIAAVS